MPPPYIQDGRRHRGCQLMRLCVLRRRISFCKSSADDGGGGGRLLFGHSTRLSLVSSQWEPGNDKDNGHHEQTAGGRGRGDEDDSLGQQLSREEEDDRFREQLFFDEIEDDSIRERCGGTQLSKTIHSLEHILLLKIGDNNDILNIFLFQLLQYSNTYFIFPYL
jgi:hypothetical protein